MVKFEEGTVVLKDNEVRTIRAVVGNQLLLDNNEWVFKNEVLTANKKNLFGRWFE